MLTKIHLHICHRLRNSGDQPPFYVEKTNKSNNQQLQGFLSKLFAFILFQNLEMRSLLGPATWIWCFHRILRVGKDLTLVQL